MKQMKGPTSTLARLYMLLPEGVLTPTSMMPVQITTYSRCHYFMYGMFLPQTLFSAHKK